MTAPLIRLLFGALRIYTDHIPFARGRGLFIGAIRLLQRWGAAPPRSDIGDGLSMEFETSLVGWTIFETGSWEPEQTALVRSLVQPGHVVLDIGANTGYYALIAGSRAGASGHVFAFEIQPAMTAVLRRNVQHNRLTDRITIVEMGCYSSEGTATVHAPGDPGAARIAFGTEGLRVPLTTVDRFTAANDVPRVDLLLIDTEGADFEVLKGAEGVLERFRPAVIVELDHLQKFDSSEEALNAFMARFGYSSRRIGTRFSQDVLFSQTSAG